MGFKIIAAAPEDNETLSTIAFKAKAYWGYPQEWLELWKSDLTISAAMIRENDAWKIVSGDTIIGFTIIIATEAHSFEIEHCWMSPDCIGKGYGSKLLRQVLSQSHYQQKQFGVLADPNAVHFYQKFGFKTVREIPGKPAGRTLPWMEMTNTTM